MTTLEIIKQTENIELPLVLTSDIFYIIIKDNLNTFKNLNKIIEIDKENLDKAQNLLLNEMMSWKKNNKNNK